MSVDVSPSPPSPYSGMKRRHSPALSLDLSDLPPLITPSTPSNTLIITNLADLAIFAPHNLQAIHDAITAQAPVHSFVPLKSFRRIIAVFHTIEDATSIRQLLDGEDVMSNRIRVYFGEPTELEERDQYLHLPESQRLFFISPPPSPPVGWEMRNEEAPNKDVHADDLSLALHKLNAKAKNASLNDVPPTPTSAEAGRSRSGTLLFDPSDHGSSASLPAINLEDTSGDGYTVDEEENKAFVHTSRPPVELME